MRPPTIYFRMAGDPKRYDADTITFYQNVDFSGRSEMYDDYKTSSINLNSPS